MGSRTDEDALTERTGETVLPLLTEEVAVTKQVVETGRVQVARVTHEREQLIDELLSRETAEIERVRIGQQVDKHIKVRVAEMARDLSRERAELQDKLKAVDNRLRELSSLTQQVARVRQAAAEARQALERSARDAIRNIWETSKVS